MKNKYKVTWYQGSLADEPKEILRELVVEADTIDNVPVITILPEQEQEKFKLDIRYGIRCVDCTNPTEHWYDYGSYSCFIHVKKAN